MPYETGQFPIVLWNILKYFLVKSFTAFTSEYHLLFLKNLLIVCNIFLFNNKNFNTPETIRESFILTEVKD